MARLRYNNSLGTLGAGMLLGDTSITFASAPTWATLAAGDYIPLVLEPPTGSGPSANFEIVHVTAYTAGATTATISRGQEGTSAVAHSNGSVWMCSPVRDDTYANYALFASTTNWIVPAGVTQIRARLISGGSGGGGGGSTVNNGQAQSGGSGGCGGMIVDVEVPVTPGHTLALNIGAGGAGGAGGPAGGGAGGNGGIGGASSIVDSTASATLWQTEQWVFASSGASASSTVIPQTCLYNFVGTANGSTSLTSGSGGPGSGFSALPFDQVIGGAGGNAASATVGGGGGNAQSGTPISARMTIGPNSATTAGVTGQTATTPGCGGGGGGGGANNGASGAGGSGGAGAPGQIEIWY